MSKAIELLALAKTLAKDTQQSASFIRLLDMIEAEVSVKDAPANPFIIPGKTQVSEQDDDPRAPNCRFHSPENEAVTGVWLTVHKNPQAKYKCYMVRLIDETQSGGRHVAYVSGVDPADTVILGTGYGGSAGKYDARLQHSAGQEIVIDGKFSPPALGPLAIFVQDGSGTIVSDQVASLGLPHGHHVSYAIDFQKR